jgi:hypothetical protein
MSRSLIPGPEEQQSGRQEDTMARVAAYTHHFPRRWRGRCVAAVARLCVCVCVVVVVVLGDV